MRPAIRQVIADHDPEPFGGKDMRVTYSPDPAIRTWVVSALRINRGWGSPTEMEWPYESDAWPHCQWQRLATEAGNRQQADSDFGCGTGRMGEVH